MLSSDFQSAPCLLADLYPILLPPLQRTKGDTQSPGIFHLGHLTPPAHFFNLSSLTIVEEQIKLVQQIRDRHGEQLRNLLHLLDGVVVPLGILIAGICTTIQTGVVCHISLQQTMLVSVPPKLVRYIVDLSWICVDKIELLRLHQRVGLDKPETMNIQGRLTDHIESIACHDYHAFRRLAKHTPSIP